MAKLSMKTHIFARQGLPIFPAPPTKHSFHLCHYPVTIFNRGFFLHRLPLPFLIFFLFCLIFRSFCIFINPLLYNLCTPPYHPPLSLTRQIIFSLSLSLSLSLSVSSMHLCIYQLICRALRKYFFSFI